MHGYFLFNRETLYYSTFVWEVLVFCKLSFPWSAHVLWKLYLSHVFQLAKAGDFQLIVEWMMCTANGQEWSTVHISSSSLVLITITRNLELLVLFVELYEKRKWALPSVSDTNYTLEHVPQRPQLFHVQTWGPHCSLGWSGLLCCVWLLCHSLVTTSGNSFTVNKSLLQVNVHRNYCNKLDEFFWLCIFLWLQDNSTRTTDY